MKKLKLILCFLLYANVMQAQTDERPLQNRNTKTNINTTNNNSNSGVNPNGNPGTIISNSAISGGNPPTSVSPYPPSPPSQYFEEPAVRDEITELNNNQPIKVAPVKTITKKKALSEPMEVVEIKRVDSVGNNMKVVNIPSKKQTYKPLYQTYIPANVVEDIKKKFGDNVYDIVLLNSKSGKQVYIVRIIENGVFRTERLTY